MKPKILIIIPAYNEEATIARVVQDIRASGFSADILVINDGSDDRTEAVAEEAGARVVSLPYNLGIGGAVQTGFQFAREFDYDLAVQLDGDGQHDPIFLDALTRPILEETADMTIGSRFLPPHLGYQSSFVRRIGIHFFARLISLITRYKVTDPTSGFRACGKKVIKIFSEYYPSDYPEPEAIVAVGRFLCRIQEVPVKMRERAAGKSSIRYLRTLYYMVKVTLAILLDKLKRKEEISC